MICGIPQINDAPATMQTPNTLISLFCCRSRKDPLSHDINLGDLCIIPRPDIKVEFMHSQCQMPSPPATAPARAGARAGPRRPLASEACQITVHNIKKNSGLLRGWPQHRGSSGRRTPSSQDPCPVSCAAAQPIYCRHHIIQQIDSN